ncbi:MAG: SufD family Fe-S cluster assembly protein [Firmicutes bacterium]|nr:SufD family Fe-S cluster assembly protein [Bacillota bacterium]
METQDAITKKVLKAVAGLSGTPTGAYNIRVDGQCAGRRSSPNISITGKSDVPGIDIRIKDGTVGESCHIPVVVKAAMADKVLNDFYIGENCQVTIIAGCGIHNDAAGTAGHDGVHRFFVGKNSKVKYVEKHYGTGKGSGARVMNPETVIELSDGAVLEIETVQIGGVDETVRKTAAKLRDGAKLLVKEKLLTDGAQKARTEFSVDLDGADSKADVVSRSVAKGESTQEFFASLRGNNACTGHSECDAIIMDSARVSAVPEILANHADATLVHEAAIGKIAGEQLTKLMSLGLSEKEAEQEIINGFLR